MRIRSRTVDGPAVLPRGVVTRLVPTGPGTGSPRTRDLLGALDRVERERAARFADPAQAAQFVAGRSGLRALAAGMLGIDAARLVPDYTCPRCSPEGGGDHGRPAYGVDGDRLPLALSLSRAPGFVLLGALAWDGDRTGPSRGFGVDVTAVGAVGFDGFDDVALTVRERRAVSDLLPGNRAGARAQLWARKEALAKALGTGFGAGAGTGTGAGAGLGTGTGAGSRNPGDVEVLDDGRVVDLQRIGGVSLAAESLAVAVAVIVATA